MSKHVRSNFQPRLMGFLCEHDAHAFYDISSPLLRELPANFVGLPVASISQVQTNEVMKAFLAGADGVLIAGCEACQRDQAAPQIQKHFSEIGQALVGFGIDPGRVRLEWIAATEGERFIRVVYDMMENLRRLPALHLPAGLSKSLSYCG